MIKHIEGMRRMEDKPAAQQIDDIIAMYGGWKAMYYRGSAP